MHDTILLVFTGILAFAVLFQTFLFFGMFQAIRKMAAWMDTAGKDLLKNVENVAAKADESLAAIKHIADGFKPIQDKVLDTAEIIHKRVIDVDLFLGETIDTARSEIACVQEAIKSAKERIEELLETLQNSVLVPISRVTAISRAVRVGLEALFRKRRKSSSSTHDEEMFI
jgi:flagellar motility protein MotE (MotC chaperone)